MIDWALFPIHYKSKSLGIRSLSTFIRGVLFIDHDRGSTLSELRQRSAISDADLTRAISLHRFVQEAGWLTWEEYCYLIVATSWSKGDLLIAFEWARDPKRIPKELQYLKSVMQRPEVKPYVPVLKKVIKRFLWDPEMKKKYPEAMRRRFHEFEKSGLTLNFTEADLERDEKARLEAIRKDGDEESKSTAPEKDVESETVSSEAAQSATSTSDDTSNISRLEQTDGDVSVTK